MVDVGCVGCPEGIYPLWLIGAFSATRSVAERKCPNKLWLFVKSRGRGAADDGRLCRRLVHPTDSRAIQTARLRIAGAAPLHPERSGLISPGAKGRTTLQCHVFGNSLHIPQDRRIENPGIVSRHFRIGVSEHLGDVFNGRAAC